MHLGYARSQRARLQTSFLCWADDGGFIRSNTPTENRRRARPGAGALQNILPESLVRCGRDKASRNVADTVGQHHKGRYGSVEGFKEAIATDPAG